MTDRPLIFTGESVRGILAGTKTMTRRLIGKRPVKWAVGDRILVKEASRIVSNGPDEYPSIIYRADRAEYYCDGSALGPLTGYTTDSTDAKWTSPLFLPRWASRITLEVTGVREEHLHDMPKADVYAEGITEEYVRHFREWYGSQAPWMAFANKWNEINGHRAPWGSNPLVQAITFRRIDA